MTAKTILVLGAQGVLGTFAARRLSDAGHAVLRGGRRADDAADFRRVDLDRPETLAAALAGVDLVVSCIEDPQVRAELEILRRGGMLLSLATIPTGSQRLLAAEAAKGAKGSVVLNSGLSGVGALVIKDLLERHPEADTIERGYVISVSGSAGLAGARYIHRLLTERQGLRTAVRRFPPPRGRLRCFDLSDNDQIWMSPALAGGRKARAYLGVAEAPLGMFLRLVNTVGLLARVPESALTMNIKGKPTPRSLTREPMRVRLAVYAKGKLVEALGIEAEGDYNSSVQSTVLFTGALLARGEHAAPVGLSSVEDLFQLQDFRADLEAGALFVRPLAD
jgi:hypothetical protein